MIDQNFELERDTENSASLLKFDSALKRAIKLLSVHDFSISNMKEALLRHGFDDQCISDVIEHLLQLQYLDDERLAINLLEKYVSKGKGPHYIKNKFLKHGLTFSIELYRQFFLDQGLASSDHLAITIERASRKYLHQCDSPLNAVLSYLFRQVLVQDQSEIDFKSTMRQLWDSKQIHGSN